MEDMIIYKCPYCGTINEVNTEEIDEYVNCSNCDGLVDVEIDDDGNIVAEEF